MMRIAGDTDLPALFSAIGLNPSPTPDHLQRTSYRKPPRRKTRSPSLSGVRLKTNGGSVGKRSRPETPLLRWKFDDGEKDVSSKDEKSPLEFARGSGRKVTKGKKTSISARKLAAGLWRLQLPEASVGGGERHCAPDNCPLGFQSVVGNIEAPFLGHHNSNVYGSEGKDHIHSLHSVSGRRKGYLCKVDPSFKFSNAAMEGATKWENSCLKTSDEIERVYSHLKLLNQQVNASSVISVLKAELEQSRARIDELESEQRSSKQKLEHFLRKLGEERATWRSREHEKVRMIIDDINTDLIRERKNRQKMEIVNSKLVNEVADAKLAGKRFMQDCEKERKARELTEEVLDELAKEVGEHRAEVEALKRESMRFREEVEEERKMLQMAEVWREERVQMKLVDAKVTLEEKYSQMNMLMADLQAFLSSKTATPDVQETRKVEFLRLAAASMNIQDIKEFSYDPPSSYDIFSVFEDVNCGEPNEREIEACVASPDCNASKIHTVSPEVDLFNKNSIQWHSNAYHGQSGDIEEDASGWETVSHLEDQGSSYSPEGSAPSVNKICQGNNVSESGTEWEEDAGEETPVTEISEVCSVPTTQLKKVSSISRLWRSYPNNGEKYKIISVEGMNGRLSNGRLSNGAIISPDRCSGKGGLSPLDMKGQWSSPDSANLHINRGMKGCIEWPRGMQKNSLKAKLLEARMECQKIQLRHVLKQKI